MTLRTTVLRLPKHRPPVHPGEMLREEFLKPLELSRTEFARRSGMSYRRLNAIAHERRGFTMEDALRLPQVLGTTPGFWLNMQQDWHLWHLLRSPAGKRIAKRRAIRARESRRPTQ